VSRTISVCSKHSTATR